MKVYSDVIEKDTIYSHTGDDNLSEFKYVLIYYNIKSSEILSVEKGVPH